MTNDNKNKPFFCYSKKLKDELVAQGIRYASRGIHEKTQKPFWVFMPIIVGIFSKVYMIFPYCQWAVYGL